MDRRKKIWRCSVSIGGGCHRRYPPKTRGWYCTTQLSNLLPLCMCTEKTKVHQKSICILSAHCAGTTVGKIWKQSQYPSTEKGESLHLYDKIWFNLQRGGKFYHLPYMEEPREHCAKWNKPNTEKILYNFIYNFRK